MEVGSVEKGKGMQTYGVEYEVALDAVEIEPELEVEVYVG